MSTTTSHPSESEGPAGGPARPARLIQNEATTEIPVHLLFRDDPDPATVALRPAVVSRRQGTGEQPRPRRAATPGPGAVALGGPRGVVRRARVVAG
ncbi:SPFH domain-containing protein, partial [Streptomyces sp. NPDC052693]